MGKGQKLYKYAKNLIPNGNMLLSKRPENFLPDLWPAYYESSEGCEVTDLDGRVYKDLSIMGIGTNILGYSNKDVDRAVINVISKGVSSSLNCPEEVQLTEKLIEINPWADMVRLARTGGEINSIAIRLARAYSGKDKVLFSGYHGWHDWYLSSNIEDNSNLNQHLMDGLKTSGVPKALKGTSVPFMHNDIEDFMHQLNMNNDIGVVKIEVERNFPPNKTFLETVRNECNKRDIVLIFDECTSGFRETFGGIFMKYNVVPDIALFSKALGNGYAICAAVGIERIMNKAKDTFISSTFWTERIGPTAALETLRIMEQTKSWEKITRIGKYIKSNWLKVFEKNGFKIKIEGLAALPRFTVLNANHNKVKTLITF